MPATGAVPCFKVKVVALTVRGSINSLKMAVILLLMAAPMATLAGMIELTVGDLVSGVAPVVKFHVKALASALPATSLAPGVIVAVNAVPGAREVNGVKVAVTRA